MCDCIDKINLALSEGDQELPTVVARRGDDLVLELSIPLMRKDEGKIESRKGRPRRMVAKYCPFCGEKQRD
ncbi:hypothetical protein [Telmatospirillum sp. J64-1]|uniref:hypothetical protein n=1 Tax=Telmatospirillum sp. J64-1 TaxID=2502183 RepID=UPI00115D53D9|nr:hypothetical protein [Telmatospirillum sp. J64-1]